MIETTSENKLFYSVEEAGMALEEFETKDFK
jgi:hypothetical protein